MTQHLVLEREADAIAVHDSIPSLRREALLVAVRGSTYALFLAFCIYVPLLMWQDVQAGVADGRTKNMMFMLPLIGIGCAWYVLRYGLRLWRTIRRLLHGAADLRITPEGLENPWSNAVFPWSEIAHVRPAIEEFGLRLDIVLRPGSAASPNKKNLSPSYRLDDMPVLFDTLYAIARYVPVAWLPHGYRPVASVLQDWPVPPQNRVYLPGEPPQELLGSDRFVTLRHRRRRRLLFAGLFMLPVSLLMIYIGWGAGSLPSIREISFLWMLKWLGPVCVLAALLCIRIGLAANHQLQADRHGVRLARFPAYGIIPWTQILDVALLGWTDYRIVAFAVVDLAQREARLPWYKRWLYRLRRRGKPMLNCILRYEEPGEVRAAHIMMAAWQEQVWWTSSRAWLAAWHVRGREPSGR
jgi:hypothetical protein